MLLRLVSVGGTGEPSVVLIQNTAPKTSGHPMVSRPSYNFGPLEGPGWVRCDIGSRGATPMGVFSERGHPAFTSATPSPPDHCRLTASPVVTDVVSVSSLPVSPCAPASCRSRRSSLIHLTLRCRCHLLFVLTARRSC